MLAPGITRGKPDIRDPFLDRARAGVVELATQSYGQGGSLDTEYWQFIGALILFLGILIGSYWFVVAPTRNDRRRGR